MKILEKTKMNSSEETNISGEPLYFKNNGLFTDSYLLEDLPTLVGRNDNEISKYWNSSDEIIKKVFSEIKIIWNDYKESIPEMNESTLEDKWIRPILSKLGWEYDLQARFTKLGQLQIPDYAMFENKSSFNQAYKTSNRDDYFKYSLCIADAKAWSEKLDGKKRDNSNPSYQIVRYILDTRVEWGILTNGKEWRLYSLNSSYNFDDYFQMDLYRILQSDNYERFKMFFNFFQMAAFVKHPISAKAFLDVVLEEGKEYAVTVEEDLAIRVFPVVESICKGFLESSSSNDLKEIYENSLRFVFRLIFVLNCESNRILQIGKRSGYYQYSLRKMILDASENDNVTGSNFPVTYQKILTLFEMLSRGDEDLQVPAFGDDVFSFKNNFFKACSVSDKYLNQALVRLSCNKQKGSSKWITIDFKKLSVDHVGSLFEGLLEYELKYADTFLGFNKAEVTKSDKKFSIQEKAKFDYTVEKNDLVLLNESPERKNKGAFYTPEFVVDSMVKDSLELICKNLNAEEITTLKILDPAMGSGHFLLGVVRFLEKKVKELFYEKDKKSKEMVIDPQEIRYEIMKNCIFGVDLNSTATDLAKFSLWIYSIRSKVNLVKLDKKLIWGNSIVEKSGICSQNKNLNMTKEFNTKFDLVIGNPPYGSKISQLEEAYFTKEFPTFAKVKDVFQCFIEMSFKVLKENGVCTFIIPSSCFGGPEYITFREEILRKNIMNITHLPYGVFKDAYVDTSILTIRNSPVGNESNVVRCYQFGKNEKIKEINISPDAFVHITQKLWNEVENKKIVVNGGALALINKLSKKFDSSIGNFVTAKRGVLLGSAKKKAGKQVSTDYKYFSGSVYRFDIRKSFDGWVDFNSKMSEKPKDQHWFNGERILLRRLVNRQQRLMAEIITERCLTDKNLYILKNNSKLKTETILAVVNSKLYSYLYINLVTQALKDDFPQVTIEDFKKLPFPKESDVQLNEKALMKLSAQVRKLNADLVLIKSEETIAKIKQKIFSIEEQIDKIVYKMFKITSGEIEEINLNREQLLGKQVEKVHKQVMQINKIALLKKKAI
jgi:type I restriction-modification system DNA methylase subunit